LSFLLLFSLAAQKSIFIICFILFAINILLLFLPFVGMEAKIGEAVRKSHSLPKGGYGTLSVYLVPLRGLGSNEHWQAQHDMLRTAALFN